MGLNQMGALTGGKKYRQNYVSQINAQTPYLPALYSQKKDDQWRDKNYDLDRDQFEQNKTFQLAELGLARDAAKQAKKANKKAQNLGYANIGLNAAMGGADIGMGLYDRFSSPEISEAGGNIVNSIGNIADSGYTSSINPLGNIEGSSPDSNWLSEGFNEFISPVKKLGGSLWDAGKGLFDSISGSLVDFGDADSGFDTWWGGF